MTEKSQEFWLFISTETSDQIDELLKIMDDRPSLQELKSIILRLHKSEGDDS